MPWDSVRETHGNSDIRKAGFPCSVDNKYVCYTVEKEPFGTKSPWRLIWEEKPVCDEYNGEFVHADADKPITWKLKSFFWPCSLHVIESTQLAFNPPRAGEIHLSLSREKKKTDSCGCISRRLSPGRCAASHRCASRWLAASCKSCCHPTRGSCSMPGPPLFSSFQTKSLARNRIYKFVSNIS